MPAIKGDAISRGRGCKVVSRLEMDSRWALARSVRALVAERDALKEKLEFGQTSTLHVEARTF